MNGFLVVPTLKGAEFCLNSSGIDDGILYLLGAGDIKFNVVDNFLSDVLPPNTVPNLLVG